jgi:hypothetical protein
MFYAALAHVPDPANRMRAVNLIPALGAIGDVGVV